MITFLPYKKGYKIDELPKFTQSCYTLVKIGFKYGCKNKFLKEIYYALMEYAKLGEKKFLKFDDGLLRIKVHLKISIFLP